MIRGLIFDFDGLILDTELPQFQAWQEIYTDHGCDLPISEWAVILGSSSEGFDPIRYLERQLNLSLDREELLSRREIRCQELLDVQELLPGVLEYLKSAKEMDLKLAVASSSDRAWVVGHLTAHGILDYFDVILSADDVEKVKPDPRLFNAALQAIQLKPDEAIVLEDSPNGVLAAKTAGITCVAVPNELTRFLDLGLADFRIPSLAEVPLPELLRLVHNRNGHHR